MDLFKKGWYTEVSDFWPSQAFSLEVKKVLFSGKTKFQKLEVLETKTYGKCLCLDGVIQISEKDEHSYQEMMAHPALFAHPNPQNVLVIGGGDGGCLREILKHKCVKQVDLCEIDEDVIKLSQKWLPKIACSFEHEKVKVHIKDGFEFLKENKKIYDVILVDSSDPIGPAESLYTAKFYKLCYEALRKGGVFTCQAECMWLNLKFIKEWRSYLLKHFKESYYGHISIPTYPCGTIGFLLSFKDERKRKFEMKRKIDNEIEKSLKYYSKEMHNACFVLPKFVKKGIYD